MSRSTTLRHSLGAVLAIVVSTVALVGLMPSAAHAATRDQIVTVAYNQWNDDTHNHELGGYNCNFFTAYFGAGSAGCSNGWRTEEWCADFARYTWGRSGVAGTGELNAAAASFYSYGVNHGTWHGGNLSGIQPGDAIVFGLSGGWARHVGIYVGDSLVISGNSGPNSNIVSRQLTSSWSDASGYTRPVL